MACSARARKIDRLWVEIINAIRENSQENRKEWLLEKFVTKDSSRFWGTDNHPIELWSNKVIDQKLDYLHKNPVEEGLVFHAEHYVYSSAIDYAGEKGLLDVNIIWISVSLPTSFVQTLFKDRPRPVSQKMEWSRRRKLFCLSPDVFRRGEFKSFQPAND